MLVTRGAARAGLPPVALTIGNFDGVHKGHQAMLVRVRAEARSRGWQSAVLTFEPHPRERFTPMTAPTRLTSLREKLELLAGCGIDRVHVQQFSRAFSSLAPEAFVERVLVRSLAARWVLVGDDFRFGAKRAGDIARLRELGADHGFTVAAMPTVEHDAVRVSSSAVREALATGQLGLARELLGRPYGVSGRVVQGDKVGRTLGFPTANIQIRHNRPPLSGIFAVRLHGAKDGGRGLPAVASLGVRPTVKAEGSAPVLEVHVFDFHGDLYGRHVRVDFLTKIRDEAKYADLDTLRARIAQDCEAARAYLKEHPDD